MGIWLKEAMKIEPFSRTQLVAGFGGIDHMVVATNIQEVPNVDRWLYGGEILFTSGYAFGSIDEACELMHRVSRKGIAAMVIKPGQYLASIPQKMLDCANQIDLPLFEMPGNLPYMDCIVPIEARITNEHAFVLERTEQIHNRLLQVMVENKGLDGICDVLYHVIGKPVFIFSGKGELLSAATGDLAEEMYILNMQTLFDTYLKQHHARSLLENKYNKIRLSEDYSVTCIPVSVQHVILAYELIDCSYDEIQNTNLLALENASSVIAVELLQEQALIKKEEDISAQLLDDILKRKYEDINIIQQRCRYAEFEGRSDFCICVIGADAFESWMQEGKSIVSEAAIQDVKQNVSQVIQEEFQKGRRKVLSMLEGVGMIVMVTIKNDSDMQNCEDIIGEILGRFAESYPKMKFSAGIGRVKKSLEQASDSLREARLARKAGRQLKYSKRKGITSFEDLSSLCFLYEYSNSSEMKKFYEETLGSLIDYDESNGTELVPTLECYFTNMRNLRITSEKLFIHKNSVIYRIKKIEEIIGESLDDYETAFNLMLCLKMRSVM